MYEGGKEGDEWWLDVLTLKYYRSSKGVSCKLLAISALG